MTRAWLAPLLLAVTAPAVADDLPQASPEQHSGAVPADQQDMILFGPLRPLVVRLHLTVDGKPFRQLWKERIEQAFAEVDADRDGRITAEEAARLVPTVAGPTTGATAEAFVSPATGDATITLPIVIKHFAKHAPPLVVREEPGVSGTAIFSILDADGDRRLSRAELEGAGELLRRRDFNDDEVITADELIEDPRARANVTRPSAGPRSATSAGAVLLLDGTQSNPAALNDIAAALLAHYDRDSDRRLASNGPSPELVLDAKALEQLPVDGAGEIGAEDLAAFCRKHLDLEVYLGLGSGGSVARGSGVDDAKGALKIRRRLSGVLKIEGRGIDIEIARNNRNPAREADEAFPFAQYDKDANGYLDEAESANLPSAAGSFAAMDADRDGKVFKNEFEKHLRRKAEAAGARLLLKVLDRGQDLFDLLDTMPDNQLSIREILAAPKLLATIDSNGDGYLAGDEIAQRVDFELSRAAAEIVDRPEPAGRVTVRTQKAGEGPAGPDWFVAMDRNQDGDVSAREFLGTSQAFARLDRDHNGLIDADEAHMAAER